MAKMTFEFLDIGMGDSTLVIMGDTPKTQQLALVDCGIHNLTQFDVPKIDALKYLVMTINDISAARGTPVPYLDHLFITHPHSDHYNCLPILLNAPYPSYKGKSLGIGALTYGGPPSLYKGGLIPKIAARVPKGKVSGLPTITHSLAPLWKFAKDEISVYVLSVNSPVAKVKKDLNQLSLCLMFADQSGNKVILTGDAGKDIEAEIIANFKKAGAGFLKAYGIKLGHHGSDGATSTPWISAVQPKAIFATGDFVWAHPYCSTIDRVIKAKTLNKRPAKHWYCCGTPVTKKKTDYSNHETLEQIHMNLWYVVKDEKGQTMLDENDGEFVFAKEGWTYGVQWELEFDEKDVRINRTTTSIPQ